MEDKHNHHILPRLYLKGFAEDSNIHYIWEYQQGHSYFPGRQNRSKYNPVRIPIRQAGAMLNAYALSRSDGTIDFNTFENALERLEKPADTVFQKIRALQSIDSSDRDAFAAYIVMMIQRVPSRAELARYLFPDVVTREISKIRTSIKERLSMVNIFDISTIAHLISVLGICSKISDEFSRNGLPRELELRTMVENILPQSKQVISSMRWQFLIAEEDDKFVTSDNPVHIFKGGIGLVQPYSELVFPISSRVSLLTTFRDVTEGYISASTQQVEEINRRVIANATKYIYSSRNSEELISIINRRFHQFALFYQAPELTSSIIV